MSIHLWLVPLAAVTVTQVAVLATSIYLHRALAHRALRVGPLADLGFRTILWITTGQVRREWVAVHRKHHTFTDRPGDPHSPQLVGFWRVQVFNVYYYVREARSEETLRTFAPDLQADRIDRVLFSRGYLGLGLGVGMLCLILGFWPGVFAALLHAVLYVFVVAPVINALGHWRGSQNFANTAFNSRLLSYVTGGEALHNNHHANPRAPRFSVRRSEFDPSWLVIRICARLGLLQIVGEPVTLPAR